MKNENLEEKKGKKGITSFDIKAFFNDNKKAVGIGAAALVVVVIVIVGVTLLFGKSHALPNQKEVLENRLKELAKEFYEVHYYPNLVSSTTKKPMTDEEKKEFAQKFKDTGITLDLSGLARLYGEQKDSILEEFKNGDKACNYDNTKVVIYPKDPYAINSYEIDVKLDCGFEEEK